MTPIKIVHFADAHLGVENTGQRVDPATGLSVRLGDFLRSFDAVVDEAISGEADLVIFAGDAYKTRNPSPTSLREFARRIQRLSKAGVPVVLLAGNHDVHAAIGRAHTMDIFDTLEVENVYVARAPTVFDIETRHGPIQVGAVPWVNRSGLLARDEHKNKRLEEITHTLIGYIEQILTGEGGLVSRLRPGVPHVLTVHGTVMGATYGSERSVMLGKEMIFPLDLLKDPRWDYVALGHIHRHQALEPDRVPPVVYPGSIERIDFGEEQEDKGFIIAYVEPGRCSWAFQKLDVRPFVTIRVTADGSDPTAQVLDAIKCAPITEAVVRLFIQTTADRDALINESEIRRALRGCHYVSSIVPEVERPARARLAGQGDVSQLAPLDVLRTYLELGGIGPERIEILVKEAEALIGAHDVG